MAKQAKMKKGSIGKKALAAILAASMVLSSSAFSVLAAEEDPASEDYGIQTIAADTSLVDDLQITVSGTTGSRATWTDQPAIQTSGVSVDWANKEVLPTITVKDVKGNTTLTAGTDYTVIGHNNVNVANETDQNCPYFELKMDPNGKFDDVNTLKIAFSITPLSLDDAVVDYVKNDTRYEYNGDVIKPTIKSVKVGSVDIDASNYEIKGVSGDDLQQVTVNNTTMHNAELVAKGDNVTAKTKTPISFEIQQREMRSGEVTVNKPEVAYLASENMAEEIKKKIEVTDTLLKTDDPDKKIIGKDYYKVIWLNDDGTEIEEGEEGTPITDVGEHRFSVKLKDASTTLKGNYKPGAVISGNYVITRDLTLQALVTDITKNAAFKSKISSLVYTGKDQYKTVKDAVEAALTDVKATAYKDSFEVVEQKMVNAATYSVVLQGKKNWEGGSATISVTIGKKQIANDDGSDVLKDNDIEGYDYDLVIAQGTHSATSHPGTVSVKITDKTAKDEEGNDKEKDLEKGVDFDYTITYNNKGYAEKVVITGMGNYTTEQKDTNLTAITKKVNSTDMENGGKLDFASADIYASVTKTYNYTGTPILPSTADIEIYEMDGSTKTTISSDDYYVVETEDGCNEYASCNIGGCVLPGEHTALLKPKENSEKYTGECKVKFTITGDLLSDYFYIDTIAPQEYKSAGGHLKELIVKYKRTGASLHLAPDPDDEKGRWKATETNANMWIVEYYDESGKKVPATDVLKKTGKYKVVVTPDASSTAKNEFDRYAGSIEATFDVVGTYIGDAVSIKDIDPVQYTGQPVEPAVTLVSRNGAVLTKDVDYVVEYINNTNLGEAYAIVRGIGKYSGTIAKAFMIESSGSILILDSAQKSMLESGVKVGAADVKLNVTPSAADETLKLSYASDNVAVAAVSADGTVSFKAAGTATITVTGTSDVTTYAPLKVTVKVTEDGSESGGIKTPTITLSRKVSKKAKTFTVTTSKVAGATKWQVQYSLKSTRKANGDLKSNKTKTYASNKTGRLYRKVITCNKSGKKYYVRVRAYVNGDWSAWSDSAEGLESIKTR